MAVFRVYSLSTFDWDHFGPIIFGWGPHFVEVNPSIIHEKSRAIFPCPWVPDLLGWPRGDHLGALPGPSLWLPNLEALGPCCPLYPEDLTRAGKVDKWLVGEVEGKTPETMKEKLKKFMQRES